MFAVNRLIFKKINLRYTSSLTHKGKKVAVILGGSGVKDGSEIHESVSLLIGISQLGAEYKCFAPNIDQLDVVNHLTGETMSEKRNVLVESARIARGDISNLQSLDSKNFDAIIIPGGFGAAKNLSSFATTTPSSSGENMLVNPHLEKILKEFHTEKKPIGFCCISPLIAAKLFPGCQVTIGSDESTTTAKVIEKLGAKHVNKKADEVHIDKNNLIVTTPAYMITGSNISTVFDGVVKLVRNVLQLTK
eukprot:TRINITY_DN8313_c0_g1_i1.p1 TRINITY_DN8313_c0_g1~~TRINITY_DN8313_c0_g1_i1.p1  ORF type:complete len:248 (-),score=53.16 TRINITY_DN8313_c0_g1_i1:157-900(-)